MFMGISFDDPTLDHSTFSRFRGRFSKENMRMINHELLSEFAANGFTINEGIAIDARLVQSASHPLSNERLQKKLQKQREAVKILVQQRLGITMPIRTIGEHLKR